MYPIWDHLEKGYLRGPLTAFSGTGGGGCGSRGSDCHLAAFSSNYQRLLIRTWRTCQLSLAAAWPHSVPTTGDGDGNGVMWVALLQASPFQEFCLFFFVLLFIFIL